MAGENAVDVSKIEYDAELLTEDGKRRLLNAALISLQWEENKNELAQRATLELANIEIGGSRLAALAKLNCGILIYGKWGGGRELLLQSAIWEWHYSSSTQKTISLTTYDNLVCLQKSKDFKYYSAGQTTAAILSDICASWGVPLDYQWISVTHEKKVFNGERISDMVVALLNEVRKQTGKRYIASLKGGKLVISGYGANSAVYRFDSLNTVSVSDKLSIAELVTQVKVLGKQDDDGRAPVQALVKGNTKFGVLQEIVHADSTKDAAAATAEANTILRERGSPERTTTVIVPDLPFLRRGDKVEMNTETLTGFFYVTAVTHNAAQRKMTLTLTDSTIDSKANTGSNASGGSGNTDGYAVGDVVNFSGGSHWYSSTAANPTGGERTAGTAKITNLADGAAHPIHLIGISSNVYGWVNAEQISKS